MIDTEKQASGKVSEIGRQINVIHIYICLPIDIGLPGGSVVKNMPAVQQMQDQSWVRKIPWRKKWQPKSTPVFLPGRSRGQGNLVNYSPWGCKRVRYDLATK